MKVISLLLILSLVAASLLVFGCVEQPVCGNGTCEVGENSTNCNIEHGGDCSPQIEQHTICQNNACVLVNGAGSNMCTIDLDCESSCGNGVCESELGENEDSCPQDCQISAELFESCNINFNDPGNFDIYLGENIHPQKESDWMNYQPMKNKVNELTQGLTTDREKAIAISNWVEQSRPYDTESAGSFGGEGIKASYANQLLSIIDVYNQEEAICFDSSMITVAMLRLANIPARVSFPSEGASHARTSAYIDGKWIIIDSTFGSPNGKAEYNIIGFPESVVTYFEEMKTNPFNYVDYSSLESNQSISKKVFKMYLPFENKQFFGGLTFGVIPSNDKVYSKDNLYDAGSSYPSSYPVYFKITRTDGKDFYYAIDENNELEYAISSTKPDNREGKCETSTGGISICQLIMFKKISGIEILIPRFIFANLYDQPVNPIVGTRSNSVIDLYGHYRYLSNITFPKGQYRITYYASIILEGQIMSQDVDIAYADFEITPGETTKLTYEKFNKSNGVKQEYFDSIINRIKEVWNKCENQPLV